MSNVHGTWRCVCELDTPHIHVIAVPNHVLELGICNLHLLPRAVQAGMGVLVLEPTQVSRFEVADEQSAW